ncbi:hypothetical protein BREVUG8_110909 [Brevundimonas sp. G8]|nr:hypothetical protein BREVUG8_110909 [Brevundimonas sp. G8]
MGRSLLLGVVSGVPRDSGSGWLGTPRPFVVLGGNYRFCSGTCDAGAYKPGAVVCCCLRLACAGSDTRLANLGRGRQGQIAFGGTASEGKPLVYKDRDRRRSVSGAVSGVDVLTCQPRAVPILLALRDSRRRITKFQAAARNKSCVGERALNRS